MANLVESAAIAPGTLTGKTWRVKIIEGDKQGSSAYYPKEALEEGAALFAPKTKIYLNHPSADDKFNQPERRVQDIVGYLSEGATFDGKDLYANATFLPKHMEDIKALAEAGLIGMSIRADGELSEANGTKKLVRFTRVNSVDVVTSPGAGGGFDTLLESDRSSASESVAESTKKEESTMDPKLEEALDALVADAKSNKEAIAGLTEAVTALVAEAKANPFAKKAADAEDKKDGGKDEDQEDASGKKKKKAVKESFAEIDAALTEAKLPSASRAAVFAAVEDGAELAEAVSVESAKVKSILEEADRRFNGFVADEGKEKSLEEATKDLVSSLYGIGQ